MTGGAAKGNWADLKTRVVSGVVLAALGIGLLISTGIVLRIGLSVLVGLMIWELARLTGHLDQHARNERHARLTGALAGLAFAGAAALTVATGIAGTAHPVAAGVLIVAASFFVAMLDGLGPIPFLRAVRAHERAQMTTIYRTYLDASELIPPFVYIFAFMLFGFSGAFWVLAALLAVTGVLSWFFLPKRM